MRVTPGSYNPEFALYVQEMAEALKKLPKKPPSYEQSASTKVLLERQANTPKELDFEWFSRPLPTKQEAAAVPNAKTLDEAVGKRDFDPTQVAVVEDIRRKGRNTLGQSHARGMTKETREKAIHAFTYSEPAKLTLEDQRKAKETVLKEITPYTPPTDAEKEITDAFERNMRDQIRVEKRNKRLLLLAVIVAFFILIYTQFFHKDAQYQVIEGPYKGKL